MKKVDPVYYYRILGLRTNASLNEVKKAYRQKARKYHPDLNNNPGAAGLFIEITEAYQYILNRLSSLSVSSGEKDYYDDWMKRRQAEARERAKRYAAIRYAQFRRSELYRTSIILDKTKLIFTLIISIYIIFAAIHGYINRLHQVHKGYEKPSLAGFIFILLIGFIFLSVTIGSYYYNYRLKYSNGKKEKDQEPV